MEFVIFPIALVIIAVVVGLWRYRKRPVLVVIVLVCGIIALCLLLSGEVADYARHAVR